MSADQADNRPMPANTSHNGYFSAAPSDSGPISADPSNLAADIPHDGDPCRTFRQDAAIHEARRTHRTPGKPVMDSDGRNRTREAVSAHLTTGQKVCESGRNHA